MQSEKYLIGKVWWKYSLKICNDLKWVFCDEKVKKKSSFSLLQSASGEKKMQCWWKMRKENAQGNEWINERKKYKEKKKMVCGLAPFWQSWKLLKKVNGKCKNKF